MKNLIYLVLLSVTLISCSEEKNLKLIPLTSSSESAIELMRDFMKNSEERRNYLNEKLMDSIIKLDPDFSMALALNNFGNRDSRRANIIKAYSLKDDLSFIESKLIEGIYEQTINGDLKKAEDIVSLLLEEYPDYYQLYIISGNLKNNLEDPNGSQVMWEKALEIYPECFEALENLAFLHFPVDNSFKTLSESERDLDKAESLLNRIQKNYPKSYVPSRFLGNIYRAKSDFEKAEASYQNAIEIIKETLDLDDATQKFPYSNALLMMGHINTFQEEYDAGRTYYEEGIEAVMDNNNLVDRQQEVWVKVNYNIFIAHSYMYQKKYSEAVFTLNSLLQEINNFELSDIQKNNTKLRVEFSKFLVLGHSLNMEETQNSITTMAGIVDENEKLLIADAVDQNEINRIKYNVNINKSEMNIWFNILFGNYERANELLKEFKIISDEGLAWDPNALNTYNLLSGYNALMEGDPTQSLDYYSKIPTQTIDDNNYHRYFKALALKATGKQEESKDLMVKLANDNFATWQNAVVKNLAKAQIKTNL